MEDHMNTSRLAVTAAFVARDAGLPHDAAARPRSEPVTIYHANPHGLRDELRRRVHPGAFVNTASVHERKTRGARVPRQPGRVSRRDAGHEQLSRDDGRCEPRRSGQMSRPVPARGRLAAPPALGLLRRGRDPLRDALGRRYLINQRYEEVARTMARRAQRDRARLVGLHDARRRPDRRSGAADAARPARGCRGPGFQRRVLRHARGLLPRRGARVRRRVAAEHRRQPGRHLRPDRSDRAAAARRAASSTRSTSTCAAAISGAWTNGSMPRPAGKCR